MKQVGIGFGVAVGLESIKAEFLVCACRVPDEVRGLPVAWKHLTRADFKLSDCIAS